VAVAQERRQSPLPLVLQVLQVYLVLLVVCLALLLAPPHLSQEE
jgi:hypothetical protein